MRLLKNNRKRVMKPFKQIDLSRVKTISIKSRKSKISLNNLARVFDPGKQSFHDFSTSLPHVLVAADLGSFVDDVVKAHRKKKPVVVLMGAHVIKVGLSPLIVDMLKRRIITCIGMNSAAAIHDVEIAKWGRTSEDVEKYISDGRFGMSKETGEFINQTLSNSMKNVYGYGEALGKALQQAPYKELSLLANGYTLRVPITVHAAIGTDIVHQQPSMDGAATGELTFRDFKVLCNVVKDLRGGGVVMNIGSAVVLPEVFLKALTVARNLGHNVKEFTTANFDMIQHYRPRMNIVSRPTQKGGKGYMFTGHHEIMIPLFFAMIKDRLKTK
jgi:hypothetical protein